MESFRPSILRSLDWCNRFLSNSLEPLKEELDITYPSRSLRNWDTNPAVSNRHIWPGKKELF